MGFFYSGGGERTVLSQAKGLTELGNNVKVYAPIIEKDCFPELAQEVELIQLSNGVTDKLPLKTAVKMIDTSLRTSSKYFKDRDILIAHGQPSNWIAYNISRKTGIPYVSYLHQANRLLHPREIDKKTGWKTDKSLAFLSLLHRTPAPIKKLDTLSITYARVILTNSNWIRQQIQRAYNLNSVICYPGVDQHKFHPKRQHSQPYILTTNRHVPQKRIDYLLHCVKRVKKKYPEIKCKITGESTKHTSELESLAAKLDITENTEFTGKLTSNQLISSYQNAHTYAYTSPEEDFGLGPVEAAACGTPSIVWDHAGPRETVIDGKTGYRVKPYDIDLMAEKHVELMEDKRLRDKLGQAARKHVETKFTWETHCNRVEKVLETVLENTYYLVDL